MRAICRVVTFIASIVFIDKLDIPNRGVPAYIPIFGFRLPHITPRLCSLVTPIEISSEKLS
jgi:hypothetical protein